MEIINTTSLKLFWLYPQKNLLPVAVGQVL